MAGVKISLLPGTENGRDAFFSPDRQWVGFFADGELKKISVQGGAPVTLCDAPFDYGAAWGEDGTIVAALNQQSGLSRAPAAGGRPQPLTKRASGERHTALNDLSTQHLTNAFKIVTRNVLPRGVL